jgi:hypothetical protein
MAEFWHVSTRPPERHGDGLTPLEADRRARRMERAFTWLPDGEAVYREWRRLIVAHAVAGVQVYDARLPEVTPQTPPALRLVFPVRGADVRDFKRSGFSGTTPLWHMTPPTTHRRPFCLSHPPIANTPYHDVTAASNAETVPTMRIGSTRSRPPRWAVQQAVSSRLFRLGNSPFVRGR